MRLLAGCPPRFSRETRYGVRRENATCPTPRSRTCPQAATANGAAPAALSLPWAAPGQSKGGPDREPLLTPLTNSTRPVPGWILTLLASEFCTLTAAHKLRAGASLFLTLSQAPPCVGTPCGRERPAATAPARQLHALVRKRTHHRTRADDTGVARGSAPRSAHPSAPAAISPAVGDSRAPRAYAVAGAPGPSPSVRSLPTDTGFRLLTPPHKLQSPASLG